jgi:predicted dehydrogenase
MKAGDPRGGSGNAVRIGVIGYGYWGPHLVRNFLKVRECRLTAVADREPSQLERVQQLYPTIVTTTSVDELLASPDIDAVVIATPVFTHHAIAKEALSRGKHVLVEKPLAASVAEARELVELAEDRQATLMVDHTFVYSGAVRKIKEIIEAEELGTLYYYDSVRVNLGLFQHDTNVLWDLLPHDFSIMTYLFDKNWVAVSAVGASPVRWDGWKRESIAYVTVQFADQTIGHFHVNWLSPTKVRRTLIGGSRKMIVYDHLDPDNQVKIFDHGVQIRNDKERYQALVEYRMGDMLAPKIDQTEALEVVCRHFVKCVRTRTRPITDGSAGLRVVELLEAAQESLEHQAPARAVNS